MKKLAVLLAIVSVAVLAAPALSATNPFMDVPMNHWAYDAIGQLAAHGILSGYPDGLYKGQQSTTRYEMASALARALAVVDMTKASKQDVEMLKRLVVEFKDELEALGVRVDELDERVRVLEERLGGWHIHGSLVVDVVNRSAENALRTSKSDGSIGFDEARILFERTWGEDGEYFFRARLRDEEGDNGRFDRFYVEMPFFGDTRLTLGRWNWDWEADYRIGGSEMDANSKGSWLGDSTLTDWTWTGFGITKNFGMGQVQAVFAHPDRIAWYNYDVYYDPYNPYSAAVLDRTTQYSMSRNWMIMARGAFQFNEKFGFDIGGQAFIGDNMESYHAYELDPTDGLYYLNRNHGWGDVSFNSLWTIYAGLKFNFTENIAFKGAYYYQKWNVEEVYRKTDGTGDLVWVDALDDDKMNHWRVMLDVNQEALKFTSLWLEYGQYDAGFYTVEGKDGIFPSDSSVLNHYFGINNRDGNGGANGSIVNHDTKYWRIGLSQRWTDQWATHLFYYGYKLDGANNVGEDAKPYEAGLGVQYKMNDYTTMGLNYIHVDSDYGTDDDEDNVIRFRTAVSF